VAANILNRAFTVATPNWVWAGDITCVWTLEGWLYLAVLLDLYSRRVVGWAMGQRLTGELAEQALTMALATRAPTAGLIHHSNRGSQYAATRYQCLLTGYCLIPSMSRKGNCWDNACVESFFGTLKRELVYHRRYETRDAARQDIFEYIEVFYNRRAGTRPLAMTPQLSMKRGRSRLTRCPWNWGEGHLEAIPYAGRFWLILVAYALIASARFVTFSFVKMFLRWNRTV